MSFSQVQSSSSYQRVVTLDYIREVGDDIKINSLGPLFKFSHLLSSVNAHFPVWIQNGDKVFTSGKDGVLFPGIPVGKVILNEDEILVKLLSDPDQIKFVSIALKQQSDVGAR